MSTIKSSAENLTLNADGANNDIKFQSNGVEKASIDQDGNVAASGTITSNGQAQLNNNNLISTNTGATGEWIGKRTSSGEGIHITTTNASGTDTQRLAITCNADSADFIVKDSDIVFGTAGKGICLGVTSNTDANTLDDYEEGTWTPTVSTGITSPTYSAQVGSYTKIGKTVYVRFALAVTGGTLNSSHIYFSGLPFATEAADPQAGVAWSYCSMELKNSNLPTGFAYGTDIRMYTAATVATYSGTDLADSTFAARGSITYEI